MMEVACIRSRKASWIVLPGIVDRALGVICTENQTENAIAFGHRTLYGFEQVCTEAGLRG